MKKVCLLNLIIFLLTIMSSAYAADLSELNKSTENNRNFNFNTAQDVYVLDNSLGNTGEGAFNINGMLEENSISTIDLNGYSGFKVKDNTSLTIIGVEIKNATGVTGSIIHATGTNVSINIENSIFSNNLSENYNNSGAIGTIYNSTNGLNIINTQFINNTAHNHKVANTNAYGGAIYNAGDLSNSIISGDFINNKTIANDNSLSTFGSVGGAIYTANDYDNKSGYIGTIKGSFINNSSHNFGSGSAYGGAIYINDCNVNNIEGVFDGNYTYSEKGSSGGGAIAINAYYYNSTVDSIKGTFNNNSAQSLNNPAIGGAILNTGTIKDLSANFSNNYAKGIDFEERYFAAQGGAVYNQGTIENISGDFIGNYTISKTNITQGGAIYNNGYISSITGNFIENYLIGKTPSGKTSGNFGGAISNSGDIGTISGKFLRNGVYKDSDDLSMTQGGAIRTSGKIDLISGSFVENCVKGDNALGGAILGKNINNIKADFDKNYAYSYSSNARGGALGITGLIGVKDSQGVVTGGIEGDFTNNYVKLVGDGDAMGGGIYANANTVTEFIKGDFKNNYAISDLTNAYGGAIYNLGTIDYISGNFIGNYAKSETGLAQGGAIYTNSDLRIIADNEISEFKDNYTQVGEVKDDNAIYVANKNAKISLITRNNGHISMHDNINGAEGYAVTVTGDNTGTLSLFNDIKNANVEMGGITLNTINNAVHNYNFNNFSLTKDINFVADVDLANSRMDRISASNYGSHNGNINVVGMNLLSDARTTTTEILFADKGLKDNVVNQVEGKSFDSFSPIYKYSVQYENKDDAGYYVFKRSGKGSSYSNYNPTIMSNPVSNQAVATSVISETVKQAFNHADTFSQLPLLTRLNVIHNNKYAIAGNIPSKYSPELEILKKSTWVQPFTTFERINLNNGPSVDAVTYGTLYGFNSDFKNLGKDWYNVRSIYAGYNGASLNFDGIDTTVNGGLAGLTETFYKGNFFTAVTLTAGANKGTTSTMYGNEDYAQLAAGFGNKFGYNFEFKNGKYIIQPALLTAYSFVNTFDYTNALGIKIKSTPLHTLTLNPSIKFISNLKNGWQPYASVGLVSNVLNTTKVKANDTVLPKMTVDPYVEYGLGIRRTIKDRFTGFLQAMVRNGGRNGVALTFGFKWSIGKESL